MELKERLLGWGLGTPFLWVREKIELFSAVMSKPEILGTVANDQMARLLVTRICSPKKTFIDVGAHIGSVTAEVLRNDPSILVEAIEAIPEKVESLRTRFPSVKFHACAVGDSEGQVEFFVNTKESGYSSLVRPQSSDGLSIVKLSVPLKLLDQLVQSDQVDVIKIDVEGAELGVLRGGLRLIKQCRPLIMFESAPCDVSELDAAKASLWNFFEQQDYVIVVPNRLAHNDDGLSKESFVDSHLYPRRTTNYFGVPRERRIDFRDRARKILFR